MREAIALVARDFHAEAVALVDSGRAALQLGIDAAVTAEKGPRIVGLPAFQCFEVGAAAVGAQCRIALYDIDPDTLQPDLDSLESVLRAGARVVVIAPLYGIPVDWEAISSLVDRYGAVAIEDAAQAQGAEWRGKPVGTLGSLSILSFGRGKGWTGGGGGALCVRATDRGAPVASTIRLNGTGAAESARLIVTTTLQWAAGRPGVYGIPASIPRLGLGQTQYRRPTNPKAISAFSAGLLRRTFQISQREAQYRRANAARWLADLQEHDSGRVPNIDSRGNAGYIRFPVRIRSGSARLHQSLTGRRAGMSPSYPKALSEVPELSDRLLNRGRRYAGAECLAHELLTLPTHSRVTPRDRETILALCAEWRKDS